MPNLVIIVNYLCTSMYLLQLYISTVMLFSLQDNSNLSHVGTSSLQKYLHYRYPEIWNFKDNILLFFIRRLRSLTDLLNCFN